MKACFPQLDPAQRKTFADKSSEELGISLAETFLVWFRDHRRFLEDRLSVEGQEHLDWALDQERGIILISCHFGCVDINGALLSMMPRRDRLLFGTYRKTDEIINRFLWQFRGKYIDVMISASDQRGIVRALKKNNLVWYAPDIEVKNRSSAFVDFMGVKASTTLAISRLAKVTKAIVIPVAHYRQNDKPEYTFKFFEPLKDFPTADPEADTLKVNQAIEKMIEPYPERYWWAIKRFKNRPEGEPSIYNGIARSRGSKKT